MIRANRPLVGLLSGILLAFSVAAEGQPEGTRDRSATSPEAKVARMNYNKALKYFNKKEYAKAQTALEACLQKMPTYSEAHFLLAKSLYALQAYPEALTEIEQAKATHAESADRLVAMQENRRDDLRRRQRVQDQLISEQKQQLGRTTDPSARVMLEGQISNLERVKNDMERELNEFPPIARGMSADYFFFHGNILLRLQRLDEAVTQYRKALELQPVYPEASNNLASLYYSAKRADLARQVIDEAEAAGVTVNPELKQAVLKALEP